MPNRSHQCRGLGLSAKATRRFREYHTVTRASPLGLDHRQGLCRLYQQPCRTLQDGEAQPQLTLPLSPLPAPLSFLPLFLTCPQCQQLLILVCHHRSHHRSNSSNSSHSCNISNSIRLRPPMVLSTMCTAFLRTSRFDTCTRRNPMTRTRGKPRRKWRPSIGTHQGLWGRGGAEPSRQQGMSALLLLGGTI